MLSYVLCFLMAIGQYLMQTYSLTLSFCTPMTLFKKSHIYLPSIFGKRQPILFINKVLESSLYFVSTYVYFCLIKYYSLEYFYMVFGDNELI